MCVARLAARLCGRKKLPFAGYSVVKELALRSCGLSTVGGRSRDQLLSKLCVIGQERFRSTNRSYILWPRDHRDQAGPFAFGATSAVVACQPHRLACLAVARVNERRLVENTGLEPVTSWLQTRRSPS